MGRRSIKSTKSGGFMNPTDQARKEARKRELKKNKKQRLLVRTAVLKTKDPSGIFSELDKLDEAEFQLGEGGERIPEKVLREKRRKLRETLDRVMKVYERDEPSRWSEYRSLESEYESRRFKRAQYYESVKTAEGFSSSLNSALSSLDDIPLPPLQLPPLPPPPPTSILKKQTYSSDNVIYESEVGPGPPPGIPPELSSGESSSEEEEESPSTTTLPKKRKGVSFEGGDEMERFMREVEEEVRNRSEDSIAPPGVEDEHLLLTNRGTKNSKNLVEENERGHSSRVSITQNNTGINYNYPPPPPPPPGVILGAHPHLPPLPPHIQFRQPTNNPIRFPGRTYENYPSSAPTQQGQSNFNPQNMGKNTEGQGAEGKIVKEAMIQAKPQIRSLSADVTRFVPVAVKIRKNEEGSSGGGNWKPPVNDSINNQNLLDKNKKGNKDAAYLEFMREMEGLL